MGAFKRRKIAQALGRDQNPETPGSRQRQSHKDVLFELETLSSLSTPRLLKYIIGSPKPFVSLAGYGSLKSLYTGKHTCARTHTAPQVCTVCLSACPPSSLALGPLSYLLAPWLPPLEWLPLPPSDV